MRKSIFGVTLLMTMAAIETLTVTAEPAQARSLAIPDISEWQGALTATQVQQLKPQVAFVINRRQYGANYVANNTSLYVRYGIPFGEYDFATFTSVKAARLEARDFYQRANPATRFYVLDYEVNDLRSGSTNAAVKAWYQAMRSLTKKKLIFYSYASFATEFANTARQAFNAQWIAEYNRQKPAIPYAMWQYTDAAHLAGIPTAVDNSRVNVKVHPISWWTATGSLTTPMMRAVSRPIVEKTVAPVVKVKPARVIKTKHRQHVKKVVTKSVKKHPVTKVKAKSSKSVTKASKARTVKKRSGVKAKRVKKTVNHRRVAAKKSVRPVKRQLKHVVVKKPVRRHAVKRVVKHRRVAKVKRAKKVTKRRLSQSQRHPRRLKKVRHKR
ncbi:glycosyl hydrolase [Lactiplantibacillus fabifermentans T30PCM01]|uniref:Glycosyl hydrolase n=1 Tax=Lactiplantibacillus fabifermentans T30PCM01 TaxID=1400520 RepID=W6TBX5_9LACO|nr:GH25 family lysozyme [Lactiplantibacillus fabifermentans]ETY73400.1 glycosyl hydrolase [Lactiplantibacillus fabifermentans T30PCM01]